MFVSVQLWMNFSVTNAANRDLQYIRTLLTPKRRGFGPMHTRLIMAPVQLEQTWNGYGFDMRDKILHVLDPVNTEANEAAYVAKHGATIELMFDGMAQARGLFGNKGCTLDPAQWHVCFNSNMHRPCSKSTSGAYVLHYTKHFTCDG
ncbi:uncharacterized protein LOC119321880 [Triticum dicoccoides]|uniref:uncharacterized protein LOC119321880 n=1 Tax=Triticum dicoccoides TaxID=85692 RepID=UPI001890FA56|nr:uncharacterized protein LOC119321880 [Triticum dicoccoides]